MSFSLTPPRTRPRSPPPPPHSRELSSSATSRIPAGLGNRHGASWLCFPFGWQPKRRKPLSAKVVQEIGELLAKVLQGWVISDILGGAIGNPGGFSRSVNPRACVPACQPLLPVPRCTTGDKEPNLAQSCDCSLVPFAGMLDRHPHVCHTICS